MNKEIIKLNNHIDTVVAERKEAVERLEGQVAEHQELISKYDADMFSAIDSENATAYAEAKNKKEMEQQLLSMYQQKLDRMESAEIVSDEEAKAFCDQVNAVQEVALAKLTDVLKKSLEVITEAYCECMPVLYDGDQLYIRYDSKVKKLKAQRGTKGDGTPNYLYEVPAAIRTPYGSKFLTISKYVKRIIEDVDYMTITGQKAPNPYTDWYNSRMA